MNKKTFLVCTLTLLSIVILASVACNNSNATGNNELQCNHNWTDATCLTPKTCSLCNETDGNALGHTWSDATCTAPKTCSLCMETDGNALGHTWSDATCTAPKTCSLCMETDGNALGHTWSDATCTSPKICSTCNETEGKALGHNIKSEFCSRCNYTELKVSDVLSAPITEYNKIKILAGGDGHYFNGGNFRIGYNSANGLYLMWAAKNTGPKDIKYLTFTVEFFNPVDDPAYDSITGKTSTTIQLIGPIEKGDSFLYRKIIGYSNSCEYIKITNIKITYMDGSVISGKYNYSTKGEYSASNFSGVPEKYVCKYIG